MQAVDFWRLFEPLPRQVDFLKASRAHRYMLYGGARGGGKSKVLRWGGLWRLLEWAKTGMTGVRIALFSEDYPTLKDRQVTKFRAEFPEWLGTIKSTQDEGLGFYLHDNFGGGAILLRNLDEPAKYQSAEFAGVLVEELTKNTIDVFDTLRGSLRWPGLEDTFFWGATNPGGVGHLWVRALWVERDYSGDYARLADLADEFCFVRSLPTDNPHLTASYWRDLNSLPEALRRAWVEGSWDVFEGQAFPEWHRDAHVANYRPEHEDADRYRWSASGDWGTDTGCLYLYATGPQRSLVRHEYLFSKQDPYTVGFNYAKVLLRFPKPEWLALDTPPVADGGPTIMERFQAGLKAGAPKGNAVPVVSIPRGKGSRHTKKQMLHEHLRFTSAEDGTIPPWGLPKLQVHESCKYLIRTLPALPLAENDSEDVDTDGDDHGYDAVAGWLMARTPHVERQKVVRHDPDVHPGWTDQGERQRTGMPDLEVLVGHEPRWSRHVP